ncbi:phosphotransferase [Mycobacterium sp. NPDC050041]|uniref:phosphotransferase n=1 Tax=Mycobacterium sp. NPDC050041 TaxID=3364293 RepID=UPI003C2F8CDE
MPDCYLCETDAETDDFGLLLADPAPAVALDHSDGCDEERARVAVAAIAGLHAPTWCAPEWLRLPGLVASMPDSAAARALGAAARASGQRIVERFGARISAEDTDTLLGAMTAVGSWVSAVQGRYSLLHGDFRLEHLLFSPDGAAVRVTGWRTLTVGLPARDVACLAGAGLEPGLRSAVDHELVTVYHTALVERGVTGYDLETCWQDYRYAMLQAVLSCGSALAATEPGGRSADPVLAMLHRACVAVRDLQTLELVAEADSAEQAAAQYLTHVNVH